MYQTDKGKPNKQLIEKTKNNNQNPISSPKANVNHITLEVINDTPAHRTYFFNQKKSPYSQLTPKERIVSLISDKTDML